MRHWFIALVVLSFVPLSYLQSQDTPTDCEGLMSPRLVAGERGYVAPLGANNVRSAPSASAEVIGQVQEGERFAVTDGPACADGYVWFAVEGATVSGWSAEGGDGDYWLLPLPANSIDGASLRFELDSTHSCNVEASYRNHSVDINRDGTKIAVDCSNLEHPIAVIDRASGDVTLSENLNLGGGDALADTVYFVGDDEYVFAAHGYSFRVYDVVTMQQAYMLKTPVTHFPIAMNHARTLLFHGTVEADRVGIDVRNPVTLELLYRIEDAQMQENVYDLTLSDDDTLLFARVTDDGIGGGDTLIFERTADGTSYERIVALPYDVDAISPDKTRLIRAGCTYANHGCQQAAIYWYDTATYQRVREVDDPSSVDIQGVIFVPDGLSFMVVSLQGVDIYDTASGTLQATHSFSNSGYAIDLQNGLAAFRDAATQSGDIRIYRIEN